ncbi:MAG TPA: orotate phosphoribosyltransferase [Actinomycetota bacterium]|nr:orotate phosphoribosyltransferase [Actinomycetota bacterium]
MNQAEMMEVLTDRGALLKGHFRLSSGRHSDAFVQKFRVLEDPQLTRRFGEELASAVGADIDVVASPAVGAVVLGFAVALACSARFVFAEREADRLAFRRGFEIAPQERVLIVEDVITTGGSARSVVDLVKSAGGEPVAVAALLDRSDSSEPPALGAPLHALLRLELQSWDPDDCPLCNAGEPLQDPGSRRLTR